MTDPGSTYPPPPPGEPPVPPRGDLYGGPPSYGGPPAAAVAPLPWEDRQRLGLFPALVQTVKLLVTSPTEAFVRARERGDYGSPLLFALLMIVIGTVLGGLWGLLMSMVMPPPDLSALRDLPPNLRPMLEWITDASPASVAVQLAINLMIYFIGLFLLTAIVHLCLLILRGTAASRAGFEGTFRATCYATASILALAVPIAGQVICWVWFLILQVLGLAALHRTSHGRAAAAALMPLALCCVCVVVAIVLAVVGGVTALRGLQ